jgi:hypothetical protein
MPGIAIDPAAPSEPGRLTAEAVGSGSANDSLGDRSGAVSPPAGALKHSPLFSTLPRATQLQLVTAGPFLFGMVCGFLLEATASGYWVVSTVGLLGAVTGGMEHSGPRAGALRGLAMGALFGVGVVLAHAIARQGELATIPHPAVLFILPSAVVGTLFGAAGGAIRSRLEQRSS